MVRAAAKNHAWVGVVTSPGQYEEVASAVEQGGLDTDTRRALAAEAFFHTAAYDAAIVGWLHPGELPERMVVPLERRAVLRYGENPHQGGASYRQPGERAWWDEARITQGKPMSFNNHLDAEAAWRLVNRFEEPAVVIVKHSNPCGVAVASGTAGAYARAWECDPLSAFGGVVGINRPVDSATAEAIVANFIEVVVAPAVDEGPQPSWDARRTCGFWWPTPPGTRAWTCAGWREASSPRNGTVSAKKNGRWYRSGSPPTPRWPISALPGRWPPPPSPTPS